MNAETRTDLLTPPPGNSEHPDQKKRDIAHCERLARKQAKEQKARAKDLPPETGEEEGDK